MNDIAGNIESTGHKLSSIPQNRTFHLAEGVEAVIDTVRELLKEGNVFVGVAGASASGKTSRVANKIVEAFPGEVVMISLDNYMKGDDYLRECEEQGNPINWDHPDFVNLDLVAQHIQTLRDGQSVARPTYSFPEARCVGHETVAPQKLVVIEGIFALHETVAEQLDLKVFVETSTHGRIIRRLMRDVVERGLKPQANLMFLADAVEPMYSEFVEPTRDGANFTILNDYTAATEAKRAQVSQCQVKYPGTLDEETLRSAGASRLASVFQEDVFFFPKEKGFETGELFRLRKEGDTLTVCYKGPVTDEPDRINAKFEFKIDSSLVESVGQLYRKGDLVLQKNREMWILPNGTLVSCDTDIKVTRAGITEDATSWIELQLPLSNEGHPQNTQLLAEMALNLDSSTAVRKTYDELFKQDH